MKKLATILPILIMGITFSGQSLSAGWSSPGATGDTIERIYFNAAFTQVRMTSHNQNPDGCPASSFFGLAQDNPNYKIIYATLMTAQASGATVRFWLSGCSGQNNNYPEITSVQMDQ